MPGLELVPFADDHVEDAARLLAARHARHRLAEPLLEARYEDPAAAREELERAWSAENASGAAALEGGRLVGYLIGAQRVDPLTPVNVWVEAEGHAAEDPEVVRDLYGLAAARWVEEGKTRHWALVPATDAALLDSWYRLSFGQQQGHGIREVSAEVEVVLPDGFTIREPEPGDVEELIDVDLALPTHQRLSPVFSEQRLYDRDESRAEWEATLAGSDEAVLIGLRGEVPVAAWSVVASELSRHYRGLMGVENGCYLAFASTAPAARGSGIGVALTQECLRRAAEAGFTSMLTDWRITNLLSSRFWPRRGFRPAFLRLYRSIP